jgi:GNAT superfamily N-acetyltransferase
MKLRAPQLEDAPRLAALSAELGYPSSTADIAGRLSGLLQRADHCLRVAESPAGEVMGWIHAEERRILEAGVWCEIVGLVVGSAYRGHGAGRALVGEVEAWAQERSLPTVKVRSNVTREESHPFYLRLGYVRTKTQHVYLKPAREGGPENTTPG